METIKTLSKKFRGLKERGEGKEPITYLFEPALRITETPAGERGVEFRITSLVYCGDIYSSSPFHNVNFDYENQHQTAAVEIFGNKIAIARRWNGFQFKNDFVSSALFVLRLDEMNEFDSWVGTFNNPPNRDAFKNLIAWGRLPSDETEPIDQMLDAVAFDQRPLILQKINAASKILYARAQIEKFTKDADVADLKFATDTALLHAEIAQSIGLINLETKQVGGTIRLFVERRVEKLWRTLRTDMTELFGAEFNGFSAADYLDNPDPTKPAGGINQEDEIPF